MSENGLPNPRENEHTRRVQAMFGRIAGRYDLMNRLMTLGQDQSWRREAIRRLELRGGERVLDLGAGTGDIALQILQTHPRVRVVACDLTPEMVRVGCRRAGGEQVQWVIADALHLPFKSEVFQGAVSGYLLRNVPDVAKCLLEQQRVLADGGRLAALDTTPPRRGLLYPFMQFHLHVVIPWLGRLIAGDSDAYTYLPDTTEHFLTAEKLAEKIEAAGFSAVRFTRRMFGSMAVHSGRKG